VTELLIVTMDQMKLIVFVLKMNSNAVTANPEQDVTREHSFQFFIVSQTTKLVMEKTIVGITEMKIQTCKCCLKTY